MFSHPALDFLPVSASGYSYQVLWPLSAYQSPTPEIYLSSDRWSLTITATIAGGVWLRALPTLVGGRPRPLVRVLGDETPYERHREADPFLDYVDRDRVLGLETVRDADDGDGHETGEHEKHGQRHERKRQPA